MNPKVSAGPVQSTILNGKGVRNQISSKTVSEAFFNMETIFAVKQVNFT